MTAAILNFADLLSEYLAAVPGPSERAMKIIVFPDLRLSLTLFFAALCLIGITVVSSRAQAAPQRIHQGDIIEIDELGGFDFDWRGKLDRDGNLADLTKVADPVFARCKTTDELAATVQEHYARVLRDPKVTVRILDRSGRAPAYLDGAVKNPYRLRMNREVRLQELLVIAGGLTDRAGGEITVFRPAGVGCGSSGETASSTNEIKIADILSGSDEANPVILSGDIVTIHKVRNVYLIGGIAIPGKTAWRDGMTVSRAVAAAGGVTGRGVKGRATIYRREGMTSKIIEVDLDAIANGSAQDEAVFPADIIEVPMKGAAKRRQPPIVDTDEPRSLDLQSLPLRVID